MSKLITEAVRRLDMAEEDGNGKRFCAQAAVAAITSDAGGMTVLVEYWSPVWSDE